METKILGNLKREISTLSESRVDAVLASFSSAKIRSLAVLASFSS